MNPLRHQGTAAAHAATAATPGQRSERDSGPTRGRRENAGRTQRSPTPLQTPIKAMIRRERATGEKGSSRVRARDRGGAVTEPRDAARRGRRRDCRLAEKYERVRQREGHGFSKPSTDRANKEEVQYQEARPSRHYFSDRPKLIKKHIDEASELSDRANR